MLKKSLIAILSLAAAPAFAGPAGSEKAFNRQELRDDRREAWDDVRDLGELQALYTRMVKAHRRDNLKALRRLDRRLTLLVQEELGESRRELRADLREERRSAREVQVDRRRGDEDTAWIRDDRLDRRDDGRDVRLEAAMLRQLAGIAEEVDELAGRLDYRSRERKLGLIRDLIILAEDEHRANRAELWEDRHEVLEDQAARVRDRR